MQELKALEILKERYKELSLFSETQRTPSNKLALVLVEMVRLHEAIAELEALQAHKTCGGYSECKNASSVNCSMCIRYKNYSDYYEPKETQ